MTITHEVDSIPADRPPNDLSQLTALRDEGEIVTGETALREHVEQLGDLMANWDRIQSDACYIEEDGTIC